jgi:hypothetical protein
MTPWPGSRSAVENEDPPTNRGKSTEFWKIITVFILSAVSSGYGEMVLWKSETVIAIGILALVYALGGFRFMPWKTPLRKALSIGIFVGLFITIILWKFGISI